MTLLQNTSIFDGVDLKNTLQKANQSMNETVSGLNNQLINPFKTISAGVQAGVATISEKEAQITQNLSTYKSQAIDGINNSLKNITGGLFNIGDLGSIITYQDGFKVDTNELLRLGSKGLGFNINSMIDLKQQIGNGFISELDKMTFGLASGLFTADGTKIHIADDWQLNMGNSIIDFLAKDDPEVFGTVVNVAAMNSILNTMVNETIKNGLWQGYGNFDGMYTFQSDYHDALIDGIGIAVGRGDLKSVQTILDIIKEEGTNKVSARYPDLIQQMLSSFGFTEDTDPSDYPALSAILLQVCTAIGGADWYMYPTQFGMAINVTLVNSISDDAKTLLQTTDALIPFLCAAGVFVEQSALDVFISDFPTAVVIPV